MKLSEFLKKKVRKFPSPIKALDYLFGDNAFDSGAIFGLYGQPQGGKSLLALQTAYYLLTQGYNVLYIDTEGGLENFIKVWFPRFEERYGKLEDRELDVERKQDYASLLEFLGYKNPRLVIRENKDPNKAGKYEFYHDGMVKPTPLEQYIAENQIDFIILDSITAPLRVIPTQQQNFPARSDIVGAMMTALLYVQGKYDVGVLTIHHASRNKANQYDIWERMVGGTVLHHFVKRMVNIKPAGRQEIADIRKFWLVRGEGERAFGKVSVAKITRLGYVDVPESEWYKYLTNSELSRAMNISKPQRRRGR